MEYYKNLSLENLTGYDKDGNFHIEEWRDVLNYEGIYKGSTFGRFKGIDRYVPLRKTSYKSLIKGRILKQQLQDNGYINVVLYKKGNRKKYLSHRLVAQIYIENKLNKPEVNHDDRNRQHNCVWNLEWSTRKENMAHGNTGRIEQTSKYLGVFRAKSGKYIAAINYNNSKYNLGSFKIEYEAHLAYQKALKEIEDGIFIPKQKKIKTSQYIGISFDKKYQKWRGSLKINQKRVITKRYNTEIEAYVALQNKISEIT